MTGGGWDDECELYRWGLVDVNKIMMWSEWLEVNIIWIWRSMSNDWIWTDGCEWWCFLRWMYYCSINRVSLKNDRSCECVFWWNIHIFFGKLNFGSWNKTYITYISLYGCRWQLNFVFIGNLWEGLAVLCHGSFCRTNATSMRDYWVWNCLHMKTKWL